MIRATTPLHTFTFTMNPSDMSKILVTYKQGGKIVLEKTKADMTFTSEVISGVTYYYGSYLLTQEETNLFQSSHDVMIQVRVLTNSGQSLASNIINQSVYNVLNDEVL